MSQDQHSGFAAVIGRPNTGKSTLINAMVGQKVAITSAKPQTTRRLVRGIVDRPTGQLVLVDTPGIHRPRTLLGERLNALAEEQWTEVDAIAVCLPADEAIGPGDRRIVTRLAGVTRGGRRVPLFALLTKTDRVGPGRVLTGLTAIGELGTATQVDWAEVVPVSAVRGDQVSELTGLLLAALPPGPALFPEGQATDEPDQALVAELIREAALHDLSDELPHSVAVVVEEMGLREDRPADRPLLDIHAIVFVERASQKPILLGRGGARLREIGTRSRQRIEAMFEMPVFLDLHVKIAKEWQRDPKALRRMGF